MCVPWQCVEVRRQLLWVTSLIQPCGFWESSLEACAELSQQRQSSERSHWLDLKLFFGVYWLKVGQEASSEYSFVLGKIWCALHGVPWAECPENKRYPTSMYWQWKRFCCSVFHVQVGFTLAYLDTCVYNQRKGSLFPRPWVAQKLIPFVGIFMYSWEIPTFLFFF